MGGVLWWAVGEGADGWDTAAPRSRADERWLTKEIRRHQVLPEHLRFVDEYGRATSERTNRVEVRGAFRAETLEGRPLREFGLFGGDARAERNTGILINRVIHPRIDLEAGELLERRVILSFGVVTTDEPEQGPFGADIPIRGLNGANVVYADAFRAARIWTVGQLATLDERHRPHVVAPAHFRDLVAKARLIRSFRPTDIHSLDQLTLLEVLDSTPDHLVAILGGGIDEDSIRAIQRHLGVLQVALDNYVLSRTLVRDLRG